MSDIKQCIARKYLAGVLAFVILPAFANNNVATAEADDNTAVAYAKAVQTEVYVGQSINRTTTAQNFDACPDNFYAGKVPRLVGNKGEKLGRDTYSLCFDGFATLHSGISRTPIWSAEHLSKARILSARKLSRDNNFHAETRLPPESRAELSDYRRSGFDRGHLAPNGDMANVSQQFDSFSLANIAPQNRIHNQRIWREIEQDVRSLTLKYDDVYVVTGVAFHGKQVASIGSGVLVPSHFFKAVYIPSLGKAGAYYSPNDESGYYEFISLGELSQRTGVDVMPALTAEIKGGVSNFPDLRAIQSNTQVEIEGANGFWLIVSEIIKFLLALFR